MDLLDAERTCQAPLITNCSPLAWSLVLMPKQSPLHYPLKSSRPFGSYQSRRTRKSGFLQMKTTETQRTQAVHQLHMRACDGAKDPEHQLPFTPAACRTAHTRSDGWTRAPHSTLTVPSLLLALSWHHFPSTQNI